MVLLVLLDGESRIVGFCTLEISVEGLSVTLNVCRLHDVSQSAYNLYTHPFCPHRIPEPPSLPSFACLCLNANTFNCHRLPQTCRPGARSTTLCHDGQYTARKNDAHQSSHDAACTYHRPISPPMMTSCEDISSLMVCGTTPAVMGNSTGAVLTMRITLPEPGVSRTQKNGRSRPSSV